MSEIYGSRKGTDCVSWFDRRPARSNQHCLYCSTFVGEGSKVDSDKEHLIGRNMVPTNAFANPAAFNFLFRACRPCNSEKAEAEDHISAVTLLSSPGRGERAEIDAIARRKGAGSFDPRVKGTPVAEVRHNHSVKLGDMFTFGFVAGAQYDPPKLNLLAFRHIQGLFSLVTSSDPLKAETTRLLPYEHFGLFGYYPRRDWGNPQLAEIARRAADIPSVAEITTADGYFRCAMRREESADATWFWALEWNRSLRLVGWIHGGALTPPLFEDLPDLSWRYYGDPKGDHSRMRIEIPLAEGEPDLLFLTTSAPRELNRDVI